MTLNGGINASLLATRASVGAGWGQPGRREGLEQQRQVNDAPMPVVSTQVQRLPSRPRWRLSGWASPSRAPRAAA